MTASAARAVTSAEQSMLNLLLSLEFSGVDELRVQAESVMVVGGCDCGCPSVAFEVAEGAPLVTGWTSRLAPVEGIVSPLGDEAPGEIILFVDAGRLSYLEYVYYGGPPPIAWPAINRVSVVAQPR